jgi:hypothetical protein
VPTAIADAAWLLLDRNVLHIAAVLGIEFNSPMFGRVTPNLGDTKFGIDVIGNRDYLADTLLEAPAGTKLEMLFQRGNKFSIILGPRR